MPVKYYSNMELDKGIITQLPSVRTVWAFGRNVRFKPGYVYKSPGKSIITRIPAGYPIRAMFSFVGTDGAVRTIVCCDDIIYAYNSTFSSYSIITPSPAPTGGEDNIWQFALVAGLPILSNGKDRIWKWSSYAGALSTMTNSPTYAKSLSSCMHRLVASNVSEDGYTYKGRIRWSEISRPENWTVDMTNKSGYMDLMQYDTGIGAHQDIKAQISIGNKIYFFTERGIWLTNFAEPTKGFYIAGYEAEIISRRAVCRVDNTVFWAGKKDFFSATDGAVKPIGMPIRNDYLNYRSSSYLQRAFSFHNRNNREVWFCVPTTLSTDTPDTAYIYNYEMDNWSISDVNFISAGESDFLTLPYEIVGNQNGDILKLDDGDNDYYAGAEFPLTGFIETGDMAFNAPDFTKKISDVMAEPAPQTDVTELMIQVGVKNRLSDDIRWSDPTPFTLGVSDFADFNHFRKDGKYIRLRFYSDQLDTPWTLAGYSLKYEQGGTR